ncbi:MULTISPECIES: hypothetical protein [unclassified Nostoc]|uniref:hypothetical protein n=1 Tax=unclassified Nostoc TaxID=2593658 RepID=UPI002626E061|nr:hypothetical protein [Nostoc sp. S13]MDF5734628.1 hypothetical protein [Nostoc sp. S13]
MRPYTLRIRIFDWGGRLHRTRTGSERWANNKAIKLGAKAVCLLFIEEGSRQSAVRACGKLLWRRSGSGFTLSPAATSGEQGFKTIAPNF